MYEEDAGCIRKLSTPAKQVLEEGSFIGREPYEKRLGLWNEIRQNKDRFIGGECGTMIQDMDRHFRGIFDASLVCLACTFTEHDEDVASARGMFTSEEQDAFRILEQFRSIEIYSDSDLKTRFIRKDKGILEIFRQYFLFGNEQLDNIFESPAIRNSLKYYFNRTWGGYKKRLNAAASSLITEVDYLGVLVKYWEEESRRIADLSSENARRKALDEVRARESDYLARLQNTEKEVRAYQETVSSQEELIMSFFAETDRSGDENSRYVTLGEAKQYELNFIERMNQKWSGEIALNNRRYTVKEKSEENSRYAEGVRAASSLNYSDFQNLPLNRSLKIFLSEKKLLGKRSEYVVFASYLSRPEIFAHKAFDNEPLGLREVNAALEEKLQYAKQNDSAVLLCLASPTGFDEKVVSYIDSEPFFRNFSSDNLSVCLLDLETNEAWYNRNDAIAAECAEVCNPELPQERMKRVKDGVYGAISDHLSVNGWAAFNDVIATSGDDPAVVKQFFYRFADEHASTVRYVEGVGLVLMRER